MKFFIKLICAGMLALSLIELIATVGKFAVSDFAFGDKIGSALWIFHILLFVTLTLVIKLRTKLESEQNIRVSETVGETEDINPTFAVSPLLWSAGVKTVAIVLLVLAERVLALGVLSDGSVPYRLVQSCAVICRGAEIFFTLLCAVFASVAIYVICENKENEKEKES